MTGRNLERPMMTLFSTFEIVALIPDGIPLATGRDYPDLSRFTAPLRPVVHTLQDADGRKVAQLRAVPPSSMPAEPAPSRLLRVARKTDPSTHRIGSWPKGKEDLGPRKELFASMVPTPDGRDVTPMNRNDVIDRLAHIAVSLGLPQEAALDSASDLALERLLVAGFNADTIAERFSAIYASGSSNEEWNAAWLAHSAKVKAAAAEAKRKADLEAEAAAAEEAKRKEPNLTPCKDLNGGSLVLMFEQTNALPELLKASKRLQDGQDTYVIQDAYAVYGRASLMGATLRSGRIAHGVWSLAQDAVVPGTKIAVQNAFQPFPKQCRRLFFEQLRGVRERVPSDGWDQGTAEGRDRIVQFEEALDASGLVDEMLFALNEHGALTMGLSAGIDGFDLANDIVAAVMAERLASAWKVAHESARASHDAWHEARVKAVEERRLSGHTVKPYEMPPISRHCTEAGLLALAEKTPAWFGSDELYRPNASMLERIIARLGKDSYRAPISEWIAAEKSEGGETITTDELERVTGDSTPDGHKRQHAIMNSLGWVKRRRYQGNVRVSVFVRAKDFNFDTTEA